MYKANEKIETIRELLRRAYAVVSSKGGRIPEVGQRTMANLPDAIDGLAGGSVLLEDLLGLPESLPEAYEFPQAQEVYSTLEDVMTTMDLDLTQKQAAEITQATINIVGEDTDGVTSVPLGKGSALEQFYGLTLPENCEWMTEDDVYTHLEAVMMQIDPELTPEMVTEITNNTLTNALYI
jgi:hypothetical protein